jgi:hypothetical protein
VGIVAGLSAIALYFVNQFRSPAAHQVEQKKLQEEGESTTPVVVPYVAWQTAIAADLQDYLIRDFLHQKNVRDTASRHRDVLKYYTSTDLLVVDATTNETDAFSCASGVIVEHEPWGVVDFAAYVAEVMRHLSTGQDRGRWEFTLRPEGLRVRETNLLTDDRDSHPQPGLDFGQTSTMVN